MSEKYLFWIDLEMTGLDPERDYILEIASLITDNTLEIVAEGPSLIINQPECNLDVMNDWCRNQHSKSGLIDMVRSSKVSLEDAYSQTLIFAKKFCRPGASPVCGNTVFQDRRFMRTYMPQLNDLFHYRIIDVSTVKELVKRWYPNDDQAFFVKPENHRALDDIKGSIAELKHYKEHFFKDIF